MMPTHRVDDTDVNNNTSPRTTSEMKQSSVGKLHMRESRYTRNNMLRDSSLHTTTSGPIVDTLVERFNAYAETNSQHLSKLISVARNVPFMVVHQ